MQENLSMVCFVLWTAWPMMCVCVCVCVCNVQNGTKMAGEAAFRDYLDKWDRKYWATYKVLDILQKVFYRSNPAREAFVELCKDNYVQKMTFDSYLYKVRDCACMAHSTHVSAVRKAKIECEAWLPARLGLPIHA